MVHTHGLATPSTRWSMSHRARQLACRPACGRSAAPPPPLQCCRRLAHLQVPVGSKQDSCQATRSLGNGSKAQSNLTIRKGSKEHMVRLRESTCAREGVFRGEYRRRGYKPGFELGKVPLTGRAPVRTRPECAGSQASCARAAKGGRTAPGRRRRARSWQQPHCCLRAQQCHPASASEGWTAVQLYPWGQPPQVYPPWGSSQLYLCGQPPQVLYPCGQPPQVLYPWGQPPQVLYPWGQPPQVQAVGHAHLAGSLRQRGASPRQQMRSDKASAGFSSPCRCRRRTPPSPLLRARECPCASRRSRCRVRVRVLGARRYLLVSVCFSLRSDYTCVQRR